MNITKQFQAEVAKKLTLLFSRAFDSITRSQDWLDIPNEYKDLLDKREIYNDYFNRYNNYDQFIDGFNMPKNDATNLFFARLIVNNELLLVKERIIMTKNIKKRSLRIVNLLGCCSEPQTCYFDNDGEEIPIDQPIGQPIYSPVLDIAVAPTIHLGSKKKPPFISTFPLHKGPFMFEAFSRIDIITSLKSEFERYSRQNYGRHKLMYNSMVINVRPLCLFGMEIENQLDKKHLIGDFINNIMLSKYPIIILPDGCLDDCLSMLKLAEVIQRLKRINAYELLSKAIVLNVSQFRAVVNRFLVSNNIEPLGVEGLR